VLLLAVFGVGTQCVADCLTQPKLPPCHKQSQSKNCNHVQAVADMPALCPPSTETPAPAESAFEFFAPEAGRSDSAPGVFSVLRL